MLYPDGFFLSIIKFIKLECIYRMASSAIFDCLSSFPVLLLFSEASPPPLRITLTHFALSSNKPAVRLSTSFPVSGLARLGVKPRLSRSSGRAFASTHPLMFSSTSPREVSLHALLLLLGTSFFTVESTLSSPCSRSEPPLTRQDVVLAHLDSLPSHNLVIWTDGPVLSPLRKGGSGVLADCPLCGTEATLFFSAGPVCSSFSAEACAILQAFCWSRKHQQICHFSLLLLLYDSLLLSLPLCPLFRLSFHLNLSGRNCLLFPPVFYDTMVSRTLVSP